MLNTGLAIASGLFGGNNPEPAKTKAGRFIGIFTGRNAKTSTPAQQLPQLSNKQGVSGTLQFGQNQRLNYVPFAVVAGVVGVFYFLFGNKKKRRR